MCGNFLGFVLLVNYLCLDKRYFGKLPNLCFSFGRVGHIVKGSVESEVSKEELAFGSWIQALFSMGGKYQIQVQTIHTQIDTLLVLRQLLSHLWLFLGN